MQKSIERTGANNEPYVRRYPQVRSGTCEYCGVIDPTKPADIQYQLCPHYKGMELRCSYCDASLNPIEVNRMAIINVADHPNNPNQIIAWCDRTACVDKHRKRFQVS